MGYRKCEVRLHVMIIRNDGEKQRKVSGSCFGHLSRGRCNKGLVDMLFQVRLVDLRISARLHKWIDDQGHSKSSHKGGPSVSGGVV